MLTIFSGITFAIVLMLLLFVVNPDYKTLIASQLSSKPCPPGYVIDRNDFCNREISSDSKEIENVSSTTIPPTQSLPSTCGENIRLKDRVSHVTPENADYTATLTPSDVVPPVFSDSSGEAYFRLSGEETGLSYIINADVLMVYVVHLHAGSEDENGPVVFTFYNKTEGTIYDAVDVFDENLATGDITAECLEGPLKGKTMENLLNLIADEEAYVEIHTLLYPCCAELRGIVLPRVD